MPVQTIDTGEYAEAYAEIQKNRDLENLRPIPKNYTLAEERLGHIVYHLRTERGYFAIGFTRDHIQPDFNGQFKSIEQRRKFFY